MTQPTPDPWCVFVSGSRDLRREHLPLLQGALEKYVEPRGAVLLHGDGVGRSGSIGADQLANHAGEKLGFRVHPFPADWDRLGKAAGPIRNRLVAEILFAHEPAGYRLAFLAFSTGGPGTEGAHALIQKLQISRGIPVQIEKFQVKL